MNKRIGLISEHASPLVQLGGVDSGGQNVYVAHVAKQLAARGYEVDVFTRKDRPDLPAVVEWAPGVRVFHVPAGPDRFVPKEELLPYMDDFTRFVLDAARRRRYDLLHANFWMSGLVAANVKQELAIPFVVTFHALGRVRKLHQGEADNSPVERTDVEDRVVAEADHIIAECPQDGDDLIRLYDAPPGRVTIVPCGFDPSEFAPIDKRVARMALGLPADEPIVLQLGRMVPRKGVDTVIEAFARLFSAHGLDKGRLVIVGGESEEPDPEVTPEIGRLQTLSLRARVADRVTFVGRRSREELKYYYSAADVFVTTPWYEPFGITPLEAMACGTPVIGANVGGIKFSVRDGETGYLVPPKDPVALAERLAEVLRQPELRQQLGRQAYRRVNHLFTWRKVTGSLDDVYRDVLRTVHSDRPLRIGSRAIVDRGFSSAIQAIESSRRILRSGIVEAAEILVGSFTHGGKLLLCGNGGSAADAQHFAAELVGRFKDPERPALPAVALTTDGVVMTAWANDDDFDDVFARQVEALGREGDVLIGISTSGKSKNLVAAFKAARLRGVRCLAILGRDGGELLPLADHALVVPSFNTQDIQAVHMVVIHLICELVEETLKSRRWVPTVRAQPTTITFDPDDADDESEEQRPMALPAPRRELMGRHDDGESGADAPDHAEAHGRAANGSGASGHGGANGHAGTNGHATNGANGAAGRDGPASRTPADRRVPRRFPDQNLLPGRGSEA